MYGQEDILHGLHNEFQEAFYLPFEKEISEKAKGMHETKTVCKENKKIYGKD